MGLRKGTKTTGVFPGAANKEFDAHCKNFLLTQISTQRPSLIVTLGVYAPTILGSLSKQLIQWAAHRGFKKLDESGPVKTEVQFPEIQQYSTTVAALTHPSLRGPNLGRRKYRGVVGDAAELLMLKDAR
jgi:uracil-DNA glycosylase